LMLIFTNEISRPKKKCKLKEVTKAYKILVTKLEGKRPFGRLNCNYIKWIIQK
jgi:hypothetical protein